MLVADSRHACGGIGWASLLAPIAGMLVFRWLPFRPAVTAIVGLGMVLRSVVEEARMRRGITEIVRRQVHESYAR